MFLQKPVTDLQETACTPVLILKKSIRKSGKSFVTCFLLCSTGNPCEPRLASFQQFKCPIFFFFFFFVDLFINNLLKGSGSNLDYIARNNWKIILMNWLECGRRRSCPNLIYKSTILLERLKKITKSLSQNRGYLRGDSTWSNLSPLGEESILHFDFHSSDYLGILPTSISVHLFCLLKFL